MNLFCRISKRYSVVPDAKVRFLHNDADGLITAGNLNEMGVNMFNFSFNHSLGEIGNLQDLK